MIFASVFSIVVGAGMIGQWVMSYANQQIPELRTEPIRIWFHIAAEMVTALCLICGGIGLLINVSWARPLYLIAIGMLFYTSMGMVDDVRSNHYPGYREFDLDLVDIGYSENNLDLRLKRV